MSKYIKSFYYFYWSDNSDLRLFVYYDSLWIVMVVRNMEKNPFLIESIRLFWNKYLKLRPLTRDANLPHEHSGDRKYLT